MNRIIITSLAFFLLISNVYAQQCDEFNTPEKVRVYYVNGMDSDDTDNNNARNLIQAVVGNRPDNAYRMSTNRTKGFVKDGMQAWSQRSGEVDPVKFWQQWHGTSPGFPNTSPEFNQALADAIVAAATIQVNTDADLAAMVEQYLIDLNAGKKVVLVSHSQGNFYANRAQEFITENNPQLAPSMGIVSVASPSRALAPRALLTQNTLDKVITEIVASRYSTIPGNVTFTGRDKRHHGFLTTFMRPANARNRIGGHITSMINQLPEPINTDCDDRVAKISTLNASNISAVEGTLRADLTQGKNVSAWFVYDEFSTNVACNVQSQNGSGTFSAPMILEEDITQLVPNTSYFVRACAKGSQGAISQGGLRQFITKKNSGRVTEPTATSISTDSFVLNTQVVEGIGIDVWFRVGTAGGSTPPSCNGSSFDGAGIYSTGDNVTSSAFTGLDSSTDYAFRACAKGESGITTSSNIGTVRTAGAPVLPCSNHFFRGGSHGLAAIYDFGSRKGRANVSFQTFTVPDGLQIFKRGTNQVLLQTSGLVSGLNTSSFVVDASFSQVDIVVTGNATPSTEWSLNVNCPF